MMETRRQLGNRILEVPVVILAVVMSYLPLEIAFRSWIPSYGTLFASIAASVILITGVWDSLANKAETWNKSPPPQTILAATAVYAAYTTFASSALLLIYGAAYGVNKLIDVITSAHWNEATAAAICAVIVSSVLSIASVLGAGGDTRRGLYRILPSEPAPYERFAPTWRSKGVGFFIAECAVTLLLAGIWPLSPRAASWYAIGVLVVLLIVALVGVGNVDWPKGTVQAVASVRGRVETALVSLGYEVTLRPRVDDEVTDSLLKFVDMIIQRKNQVFTLRLCVATPGQQEINWNSVTDMIVAANALQQYIADIRAPRVEAVIILVDAKPDRTLSQLAESGQLRLIYVSAEDETSSISKAFEAGLAEQSETAAVAQNGPQIVWGQT
jgi:hypothetical protein